MQRLFTTAIVILTAFVAQDLKAQGAQYDMAEINNKLASVTDKKLHLLDDANAFARLQRDQDFVFIENKCKTDWSDIIDNLEAIEGGDVSTKLIVSALQALDTGDYMSAIEKLVTRYEAGTASKPVIMEVLSPSGRMRAFLADNYTHTRVVTALNKIKIKAGEDPEIKPLVDDLLSGEVKTGFDEIREDFAGTGYGNIPKILLP